MKSNVSSVLFGRRLVLTLALIIALPQWTTRPDSCGMTVAALSLKPPGETTPITIKVPIDTSANITCQIVDAGKDLILTNSSTLWFLYTENTNNASETLEIRQPSKDITLLDSHTAVLTIRKSYEQIGNYKCMRFDNLAIGQTDVYVGTVPKNVTDFKCKCYDYLYLTCTFTKPPNMIDTTYKLNFTMGSYNKFYSHNCSLNGLSNDVLSCNITRETKPVFLPMREYYNFYLTATNALGILSQDFRIKLNESVVPAKLHITSLSCTTDSITMVWTSSQFAYYRQKLDYEVQIKPKDLDWYTTNMTVYCQFSTCKGVISDLKFPNHNYVISLRVRVLIANKADDESMWSDPYITTFTTKPRHPDHPPKTAIGGFYVDSMETLLRLYWKQLTRFEYNGPGFHYIITEVDENGVVINSKFTNQSSISFNYTTNNEYSYNIKSSNDVGDSLETSMIRVPRTTNRSRYSPDLITAVYHDDRTYTISWQAPAYRTNLNNYTVFWCLSKLESLNQCKGTIHFEYVDKKETSFTTGPQDHKLNMAVSANYLDYNTGMHWAMCSDAISRDLLELKPEATTVSATTIRIQWNTENVCSSILKGYNLTYCEFDKESSCIHKVLHKDDKEYTIMNLLPFTKYRIQLFMYSKTKVSPTSTFNCTTKQSAPSEPRNVIVNRTSVTSKSAELSWMSPEKSNGFIVSYMVHYRVYKVNTTLHESDYMTDVVNVSSFEPEIPIVYELVDLNSYMNYEVYITAYTVEESAQSNHIYFTTLIGVPSNPLNVSIEQSGSYGILKWEKPFLPSGRVDFYEIAMVMTHTNKATNEIETVEKYSYLKSTNNTHTCCRFQVNECVDSKIAYVLKVRAFNVAKEGEIDYTTFHNDTVSKRRRHTRHTNPEINAKVPGTQQQTSYKEKLLVTGHDNYWTSTVPTSQRHVVTTTNSNIDNSCEYCDFEENYESDYTETSFSHYTKLFYGEKRKNYKYLKSTWTNSTDIIFTCLDSTQSYVLLLAVTILFLAALLSSIMWLVKKCNEMKNIKAVLPMGLADNMPKYTFEGSSSDNNGTAEKDSSELSRSDDGFIYPNLRENQNLIATDLEKANYNNFLSTALNSLVPMGNSEKDEQKETCSQTSSSKDQSSSQSTDSVELTEVSRSPLKSLQNIVPASGYMATEQFMYLQSPNIDGYTTQDAIIGRPSTEPVLIHSPIYNTPYVTTLDGYTGTMPLNKLDTIVRVDLSTSALSPNNNNTSSICGYVSRRQLAEFGQLAN